MLMKMAAVLPLAVLLLCCSSVSCADAPQQCKSYAATGGTATMPLTIAVGESDKLTWKHNDSVILRRSKGIFSLGGQDLVTTNGSLRLTNVAHDKAGAYRADVHSADGKIKGELDTSLCVLDPVPKPTLTHDCTSKVNEVKFTCVFPPQAKDHNVKWLQDKVLQKETGPTLTRPVDQAKTGPVACRLSNRVSSSDSEPVHPTCGDNTHFLDRDLLGIKTWIFVAVGGGVVVLLIIVVIVCCVCNRRRNRMQLEEEGELRLAWTNEKQQHHQHHTCADHRQNQQNQQPAGHTGPRQQRSRQQRPGAPEQPRPSPRRPAQAPRPPGQDDEEQPPPLPQPRKNGPAGRRV
ncbi:cd2 [Pungitius sinensis]